MPTTPTFFNTFLKTLAPAHARRKHAHKAQTAMIFDFSSAGKSEPREPEAIQARLQAAHAARRADEMRSAF